MGASVLSAMECCIPFPRDRTRTQQRFLILPLRTRLLPLFAPARLPPGARCGRERTVTHPTLQEPRVRHQSQVLEELGGENRPDSPLGQIRAGILLPTAGGAREGPTHTACPWGLEANAPSAAGPRSYTGRLRSPPWSVPPPSNPGLSGAPSGGQRTRSGGERKESGDGPEPQALGAGSGLPRQGTGPPSTTPAQGPRPTPCSPKRQC